MASPDNIFLQLWPFKMNSSVVVIKYQVNIFIPEEKVIEARALREENRNKLTSASGTLHVKCESLMCFYGVFLLIQCGCNTAPESRNGTFRWDLIRLDLLLCFIANLLSVSVHGSCETALVFLRLNENASDSTTVNTVVF